MRPRGVRPLSAEERDELTRTYTASRRADWARRCHAVLLVADGLRVPEVARLLRVDQSSVHRWLDRFEGGGVGALAAARSPGQAPRWDEAYEFLLVDTVRHDPRWHGLEQSVWTCGLLAGYLAEKTGVALSAERVRVLLHGHGIRLKQPTPVVRSPDPRYDPKGSGPR